VPKVKQTAAELKAEVELQLSQRRFILEAITAGSTLLQVPMITAFLWYYLSRTNDNLNVLNKLILAAELTPLVGDIKFPEGVLLGAAMESTEDFQKILTDAGLAEVVKGTVEDTGDVLAGVLVGVTGLGRGEDCDQLGAAVVEMKKTALAPGQNFIEKAGNTIAYGVLLKAYKKEGCPRPGWLDEDKWSKV